MIPVLPQQEKDFLARCLQLDEREGAYDWPGDWSGNLTLFFREITIKDPHTNRTTTVGFADHFQDEWRVLIKFFAYVIKLGDMPAQAKRILTFAAARESRDTQEKVRSLGHGEDRRASARSEAAPLARASNSTSARSFAHCSCRHVVYPPYCR